MFSRVDQRSRIRTLFIVIILLTLPCYCFGMILLFSSQGIGGQNTPTSSVSPTLTPSLAVTTTQAPATETLSASPSQSATPTLTPSTTYTPFSTYTPTITGTPTNTPTQVPTATFTPEPPTPTDTEVVSYQPGANAAAR